MRVATPRLSSMASSASARLGYSCKAARYPLSSAGSGCTRTSQRHANSRDSESALGEDGSIRRRLRRSVRAELLVNMCMCMLHVVHVHSTCIHVQQDMSS